MIKCFTCGKLLNNPGLCPETKSFCNIICMHMYKYKYISKHNPNNP